MKIIAPKKHRVDKSHNYHIQQNNWRGDCRVFEISSIFQSTPTAVFEFCREGENFQKIFPERIEQVSTNDPTYVTPGQTLRFRHYLLNILPWIWTVEISNWLDTPELCRFTDKLISGPLDYFEHTHTCQAVAGGCQYTDTIYYASKYCNRVLDYTVTRHYLCWAFKRRHLNMHALLNQEE